ncbi:hypothetical protein SELR_13980 [Selenomonas ruminantium subsp. lactilytica TAM6421]|uniref:Uncharacterized protein n=2 Tax=Selenomonas ruminantium TaxID=971 RepID=I0GQR9_SELRL|nr:hypothetical protein SELR_13980 [Selenomonas ruminantium subsp. lactilytica TAM6421]
MDDWSLYEDNQDLLTEELIMAVQAGNRKAEWKLLLIFKSEIIRACSKAARILREECGRPNNGPEPDWMIRMEKALIKGYRSSFRLDYWDEDNFIEKFERQ